MTTRRSPLRVLAVIESVGLGGGAERLLVSLAPELRRLGIDVEIAALRRAPAEIDGEIRDAGIPLHRAPTWFRGASTVVAIDWTRRLLARGAFEVMWSHMLLANTLGPIAASAVRGVRSVITLHSVTSFASRGFRARMALAREVGRRLADAKVAVSHATARDHATLGWRDIEVIHNGIPARAMHVTQGEERASLREALGIRSDQILLVMPARLVDQKGHDTMLEALARLRPSCGRILLVCVGQGPRAGVLGRRTAEMGLSESVRFVGAVPQPELFRWMRAADCVVLPSYEEPFGLAAAEAMAMGTPAVLTRVGGFLEIVGESQAALLVPPRDAPALASALDLLIRDSDLRLRLATHGRARVLEEFDSAVCASKWAARLSRL